MMGTLATYDLLDRECRLGRRRAEICRAMARQASAAHQVFVPGWWRGAARAFDRAADATHRLTMSFLLSGLDRLPRPDPALCRQNPPGVPACGLPDCCCRGVDA